VSGYLYRSAVLYYDSETETFWSQMTGDGVVGPLTGKRLNWIPTLVTTWKEWKARHPNTTVLRPVFPLKNYERAVKGYLRYERRGRPSFPLGPTTIGKEYEPMDLCTIVVVDGKGRCYPHKALKEGKNSDGKLTAEKKGIAVRVLDKEGKELPALTSYWFGWCAFYPNGTVYRS
jgi:hypothetical protein